jgi:hypothetical protein
MPFCTLVEFEWDETFGREQFTAALGDLGPGDELPAGCLSRITSIDDAGARVIEVWRSGDDARAFAEHSRPALAAARLPAQARVAGFETTSYRVAAG